jgi:ABC-type cobalamin transport system ATPase subunit
MGVSFTDRGGRLSDLDYPFVSSYSAPRLVYVDRLRVFAVAGVFLIHICEVFNPWDEWHITSLERSRAAGEVLDEPGVGAVYALLRRLQLERGLTVLLISHELSVVFEQADNVLCLAHGVTFFGKPIEVLTPEHLQQVYGGRVRFHRHADAAD